MPNIIKTRRFYLGQLLATPGVLTIGIEHETLLGALHRHTMCDWGDLDAEDWAQNEETMDTKGANLGRLFSVYNLPTSDGRKVKIYIITDNPFGRCEFVEGSHTTALLPEDY